MTRRSILPVRVLILGGTTEASALARALARDGRIAPVLSLAGRTGSPVLPPVPHRIGGFGGAGGLARYLDGAEVGAVVDATHPFAARISANAVRACAGLAIPLATFTRPPWRPGADESWIGAADLDGAATALGTAPRRVFLTTGRLGLAAFKAAPQHRYLIRTLDPPDPADLPPEHELVSGRGPFPADAEAALMRRAGTEVLVTKNSGGEAGTAKLAAARSLGVRVVMVARPPATGGRTFIALPDVLDWLAAHRGAS